MVVGELVISAGSSDLFGSSAGSQEFEEVKIEADPFRAAPFATVITPDLWAVGLAVTSSSARLT